ncbi:MAG: glycerol-3-phosphate acyltransferase [Bacteroidota bacterium]
MIFGAVFDTFSFHAHRLRVFLSVTVLTLLPGVLAGYLLGSFPTAYLLLRRRARLDIRRAGSGNVGALNSYEVSGSAAIGLVVLLVDCLKGCAVVLVVRHAGGGGFAGEAASGIGAVLGHAYPCWIGFKGGRGLATAAGSALVLGPWVVPGWGVLWGAGYALFREVNTASACASGLGLVFMLAAPESWVRAAVPAGVPPGEFRIFLMCILGVILTRLAGPVAARARGVRQ